MSDIITPGEKRIVIRVRETPDEQGRNVFADWNKAEWSPIEAMSVLSGLAAAIGQEQLAAYAAALQQERANQEAARINEALMRNRSLKLN